MYRVYEKTYRITTPKINVQNKLTLCHKDQCALLTGRVEITEKMDGANVGIIRNKSGWTLQKRRGLADTQHPQFSFFWNWARANHDRIMSIPRGWIIYGELLYAKHHINYDKLPSFFMTFNVWNGHDYIKKENSPFTSVPTLYDENEATMEMLEKFLMEKSFYSTTDLREGVVIKNYRKQMTGKLVRVNFMKELDEEEEHWMRISVTRNKLTEGIDIFA
jgi:hypothetical protein